MIATLLAWSVACTESSGDAAPPECSHPEWGGVDVSDALHVGPAETFQTIEQALGAVGEGGTVAVHDGTYAVGPLRIDVNDVRLVGRCRDAVRIEPESQGLLVSGNNVSLSGFTMAGSTVQGILFSGQSARATHLRVQEARGWGIATAGTDLTLEDVEILDTRTLTEDNSLAYALILTDGGEVDATDLLIDGSDSWGIFAYTRANLVLRRSRVTRLWRHQAINVSHVTLDGDVEIDDIAGHAIITDHLRSVGPVHIHDVGPALDANYPIEAAILAIQSAILEPGWVIEDVGAAAIALADRATIRGMRIARACRIVSDFGALGVFRGTHEVSDVTITDSSCPGVHVWSTAQLTLENVSVDEAYGVGIDLDGANATLSNVSVTRVGAGAVFPGYGLRALGGTVEARDVRVSATDDYGGAFLGSDVRIESASFQGQGGAGIVGAGSRMELRDVIIEDTAPAGRRGWGGYGIYVGRTDAQGETYHPPAGEAQLILENARIASSTGAGVVAVDGVSVALTDVTVTGTGPTAEGMGDGVVVGSGGRLDATGLVTSGNHRVGVLLDGAAGTIGASALGEVPGLVQQACSDAVPPVTLRDVEVPGGVRACDDGPPLPAMVTPPLWTDDIRVVD
jgi:hypothetical protein